MPDLVTDAMIDAIAPLVGSRDIAHHVIEVLRPLIAAAERERCAEVAENFSTMDHAAADMRAGVFPHSMPVGKHIAAAIRALPPGG
jgi:hypothetical protein